MVVSDRLPTVVSWRQDDGRHRGPDLAVGAGREIYQQLRSLEPGAQADRVSRGTASVPLGAGLLYVKKENIGKVWPLLADGDRSQDDIARLNHIGTHPVHTDLTIADAIDVYNMIGPERKESRLRYLQTYWTSKVRELPNVVINTPKDPIRACAIANVGIKSMKPQELADTLLKKYEVYTVAIDGANVHGCRITPNVFTSTRDLDVLVSALKEL